MTLGMIRASLVLAEKETDLPHTDISALKDVRQKEFRKRLIRRTEKE